MHSNKAQVRIIAGEYRGRRIDVASRPGLRPTPDRVRETLFNWLGQWLDGLSCLDLFAGSGALGFEAASRGAQRVVMIERDPVVFRALAASRSQLAAGAVELTRGDALEFLRADSGVYDVVFLDPPFDAGYWPRVAPLLAPRLAREALVYYESGGRAGSLPGWETRKYGKAGQVSYHLLKWIGGA